MYLLVLRQYIIKSSQNTRSEGDIARFDSHTRVRREGLNNWLQ